MNLSRLLDASAIVYTPNATTKAYTTVALSGLACRLSATSTMFSGIDTGLPQPLLRLYWEGDYTLPHDCQVEISGVRYQALHGSGRAPTFQGMPLYHSADLIRAEGA